MSRANDLERSLTRFLGPLSRLTAARDPSSSRKADFVIGLFEDVPAEGAFTLVSSGISEYELQKDGKRTRQEILFCAWNRFRDESLYQTIFTLGDVIVDTGTIVHPGRVYSLPHTVMEDSVMSQLLAYPPVYFDDALESIEAAGSTIDLMWLIPIHDDEADLMEQRGTQAFIDLLTEHDPDLLDLQRKSIVARG